MTRKTVAVVDDHPFFRKVASEYLTLLGFEVLLEASNGANLMDQLSNGDTIPDVCLLDVEMPLMDGYETARILRERYPAMRIIAHTLLPDETKKLRMIGSGADSIVDKSLDPEDWKAELLKRLEE
jgi:CheY-like chemotaxis protein